MADSDGGSLNGSGRILFEVSRSVENSEKAAPGAGRRLRISIAAEAAQSVRLTISTR
jgi:hypothetical protein